MSALVAALLDYRNRIPVDPGTLGLQDVLFKIGKTWFSIWSLEPTPCQGALEVLALLEDDALVDMQRQDVGNGMIITPRCDASYVSVLSGSEAMSVQPERAGDL